MPNREPVYLNGSPFPSDWDENQVYYHGGTAVAIEAGLLTKEEIKISLEKMVANVNASGAGSIGLTLYPPYPEGFFRERECIRMVTKTVAIGPGLAPA
jgi:hypothetical protein